MKKKIKKRKKIIFLIPIILIVIYLLYYVIMYSIASEQFKNEEYANASKSCKMLISFGNTQVAKYRLYGKYTKYYENFNEIYNKYKINTETAINNEFFDLTYGLYIIRKNQSEYYLSDFENNIMDDITKLYIDKLNKIFMITEHRAISLVDSYEDLSIDDIKVVSSAFASELYKNLEIINENDSNPLVISNISLSNDSYFTTVSGIITNRGYTNVSYVKIKGLFVNESGITIDTDWTYAVDSVELAPGESKKWEMMVKKDYRINKVNIEIIDYERN